MPMGLRRYARSIGLKRTRPTIPYNLHRKLQTPSTDKRACRSSGLNLHPINSNQSKHIYLRRWIVYLTRWKSFGVTKQNPNCRTHLSTIACPTYTAHRVNVRWYDFRNSSCQEVPNHNTSVITPHRQQRPIFVESRSHRQRNTIQRSVKLFRVVLPKWLWK